MVIIFTEINSESTGNLNRLSTVIYTVAMYRVVQNKLDYLLLLSKFCSSTTKHLSMIMYM